MTEDNYFDLTEEDTVHDAFLMIVSSETDYDSIEDVLLEETTFTDNALGFGERYE
jgi:hypothetical protein